MEAQRHGERRENGQKRLEKSQITAEQTSVTSRRIPFFLTFGTFAIAKASHSAKCAGRGSLDVVVKEIRSCYRLDAKTCM